jgi:hypothetical protein
MATYMVRANLHSGEVSFGLEKAHGAFRKGERFMSLMIVDTVH